MKYFIFVGIFIFSYSFSFSQDISQYHERKIAKAMGAWNEKSPREDWEIGSRFKSTVHFLSVQDNRKDYVWFRDDSAVTMFLYNGELPPIEKGQVAIIYYRKRTHGNIFEGPQFELEQIELTNEYFIIGDKYMVKDNLRLRTRGTVNSNVVVTIPKYQNVIVLETGREEETIDTITSVWLKVNYNDTIGWCFGGYIYVGF
ncbi:MAG: SH3 domain-containing protein [Spirochaetaceae bacterium]|jgi:hypothetical protein|nr:SH3 domain-containing protein [Spirochaetaceae bacterium]